MDLCKLAENGGLSWEAQEVVFQKIKSFGRLPGSGVSLILIEYEGWQREDR